MATKLGTAPIDSPLNQPYSSAPSLNNGYSTSTYSGSQVSTVQSGQVPQQGVGFPNQQYPPSNNAVSDNKSINSTNLLGANYAGLVYQSGNQFGISAPSNLVVGNLVRGLPNTNYTSSGSIDSISNGYGQQTLTGSSSVSSQLGSISCSKQSSQQTTRSNLQQA